MTQTTDDLDATTDIHSPAIMHGDELIINTDTGRTDFLRNGKRFDQEDGKPFGSLFFAVMVRDMAKSDVFTFVRMIGDAVGCETYLFKKPANKEDTNEWVFHFRANPTLSFEERPTRLELGDVLRLNDSGMSVSFFRGEKALVRALGAKSYRLPPWGILEFRDLAVFLANVTKLPCVECLSGEGRPSWAYLPME